MLKLAVYQAQQEIKFAMAVSLYFLLNSCVKLLYLQIVV